MNITITGCHEFTADPETNCEVRGLGQQDRGTLYSRLVLDTKTGTIELTHERAWYEGTPCDEWTGRDVQVAEMPYVLTAERANEMLAAACDLDDTNDIADLVADYGQRYGRRVEQVSEEYEAESACETAQSIRRQLAASGLEPTDERVRALADAAYAQRDNWEFWPTEADENVARLAWLVDHDAWIGRVLDQVGVVGSGVGIHAENR